MTAPPPTGDGAAGVHSGPVRRVLQPGIRLLLQRGEEEVPRRPRADAEGQAGLWGQRGPWPDGPQQHNRLAIVLHVRNIAG